jgi:DNA-binding GntR family transcriptional regulator
MAPQGRPISSQGAKEDSVVDRLRVDILDGSLAPGDRLIETQLAAHYAVGRAAIRSALLELDTEGLVEREENRGASVRRVSIAEAIEITEVRAALEGLIARYAAERATKLEKSELRDLLKSMEEAVKSKELAVYATLNRQLHRRLCEIGRHGVADDLVEKLRNRAASHQYRLATVAGRAEVSLPQHRAIVKAVIAGDGTQAELAMQAHLASVIEVLRHWEELGIRH